MNARLTYSIRGPGSSMLASVMITASLALSTAALTKAIPPSCERRASGTGCALGFAAFSVGTPSRLSGGFTVSFGIKGGP